MKQGRITGYDIARGFAILGMVIVNFKVVLSSHSSGQFYDFLSLIDGRASALFVVLAGVGLHFLYRGMGEDIKACRKVLYKRALLLFLLGILILPVWPADILHFYGVYFFLGALFLALDTKNLLRYAVFFIGVFPLLFFALDYNKGWDWPTLTYEGVFSADGMIRHLFFNGFHPVIPWAAFLLAGLWLGRQDLTQPLLRIRLAVRALVIFILAESSAIIAQGFLISEGAEAEQAAFLASRAILPPQPFYMLSAGATAFIFIIFCCGLPVLWQRILAPFQSIGRMALSIYMAHIFLGLGILEGLGFLEKDTHPAITPFIASIVFITLSMVFAFVWFRYRRAGPLEYLMRRLSG